MSEVNLEDVKIPSFDGTTQGEDNELAGQSEDEASEGKNELSEVEQEAISKGWRPKDEWKGDPDEWKSAKLFLKEESLFERVKSQSNSIKDLKLQVESLVKWNTTIEKTATEKALLKLQEQLEQSAVEGDVDAVKKVTNELVELKTKTLKSSEAPLVENDDIKTQVVDFAIKNKEWFNDLSDENLKMKEFAIKQEVKLKESNPHVDYAQILLAVKEKVKEQFPHRFGETKVNVTETKGTPVLSSRTEATKQIISKKYNEKDLPEDLRAVYKSISSMVSLDKFVQDCKDNGFLER